MMEDKSIFPERYTAPAMQFTEFQGYFLICASGNSTGSNEDYSISSFDW